MLQTLFRIPLTEPLSLGPLGRWPLFGFGIVLALWVVFGAVWAYRNRATLRPSAALATPAITWLIVAFVIVQLPKFVERDVDGVIAHQTAVIAANPGVEPYVTRGLAWQSKGEFEAALADFKAAHELAPGDPEASRHLAWLLATCPRPEIRDGKRALELARAPAERGSLGLDTLAAAYAETGDFPKAIDTVRAAAREAAVAKDPRVRVALESMRERLALYEGRRPYRDLNYGTSLPVYGYGFMLVVGFLAAGWNATRRGMQVGIRPEAISDLSLWVFFAGIFGARLLYCLQYPEQIFYQVADGQPQLKDFWGLVTSAVNLPDGGLVLYGGLLMGVAGFFVYCRLRNLYWAQLADVLMPSVFLGVAFGRLGCFLNGCCYGDRCELPWAVTFPLGSVPDMALVQRGFVAPDATQIFALHPTQIYSSLDGLVLFLLTSAYFHYRHRDGAVVALGALSYAVTRFAIEFLRGDEMGQFNTSLTISQWISIGIFVAGLVYLAWLNRRPATSAPPTGIKPSISAA